MFDWEGEELANIWGKAGEKEDHIVPFSDENYEKHPGSCGDHSKVSDHKFADATKLDLEHSDEKGHLDNSSQDFVDDNWANVGSFNDLDRILSNNEYVGNENILSIDSPNLRDLRSDCEHVKTNLEKMESREGQNEKSASNFVRRTSPPYDHAVGAGMPRGISRGNMEITGEKQDPLFFLGNEGKESEERYEQHINLKATNHETESSSYKQFINPLVSPCGSNITGNQKLTSGSFSLMPLSMTPQEKIEKLRRRQQMRALLAIRKQQREFRQIPNFKSCSNESRIDESLMMNTNSLEDSVLHQLQNVISTLGIQIRLCIRDSLFRLSQNALQRQYAIQPNQRLLTTNSSADGETKTNPIDRVVAHLLFHRPPELSLQSPSSDSRVETEGSSRGLAFFDSLQG